MSELTSLTFTTGPEPVHVATGKCFRSDAALFVGTDKAEEVKIAADEEDTKVVTFNHVLSPAQQRNLERSFGRYVVDRTGFVLSIFSQHARNHIGKVWVELARARYQATRLVQAWSHLGRQRSDAGLRDGPDERQLKLDR